VKWKETEAEEYLTISIWDALGQLVYSQKLRREGEETQTVIS
jgi:hypothetical protein